MCPLIMWTTKRADHKRTMDIWTAARGSVGDFSALGSIPNVSPLSIPLTPNVAFGSTSDITGAAIVASASTIRCRPATSGLWGEAAEVQTRPALQLVTQNGPHRPAIRCTAPMTDGHGKSFPRSTPCAPLSTTGRARSSSYSAAIGRGPPKTSRQLAIYTTEST